MTDHAQQLTFHSWVRPTIGRLANGTGTGRAPAAAAITLTAFAADGTVTGSGTQDVAFLLAGPADVAGLQPTAIVRRYPAPDTPDHESNRCPYVELAADDLPWRYTPAPTPSAGSAALHPWLVLVVGLEGSELIIAGDHVQLDVAVQAAHPLGVAASEFRFAHTQEDAVGHRVARVLCGRPLAPGSAYLAVLVPAYDVGGAVSWTGDATVSVAVYDTWRFHTAVPAGSFEDLAARLHPGAAPSAIGHAPLRYPRLAGSPELEVIGALAASPTGGHIVESPVPPDVGADLAALRLPARDPDGRPIVTLPRYGQAWDDTAPEQAQWGRDLNLDPRHRGIAGLGLEVGIRFQEELVDAVMADLGALQPARQRVRHLALGLTAARSLWQRRVPADSDGRLWLLGPGLARLATDSGTVADQATAEDRTLPRGTFSAAARRLLRAGPARTALSATAPTATTALAAANRQPPATPAPIAGLPLSDADLTRFDSARQTVLHAGHVDTATLLQVATGLAAATDSRLSAPAGQLVSAMKQAVAARKPVPWALALTTLAAGDAQTVALGKQSAGIASVLGSQLTGLRDGFTQRADDTDLVQLLAGVSPLAGNDLVLNPVGVDALAAGVAAAFDPTGVAAPALTRVLATVDGAVDPTQPLAPPEACVGLDRATWADVDSAFGQWLLPGEGALDANAVLAVESNPVFVEAFLIGLNTQLLSELRWRNIPMATGCTPLRRFWDRVDTSSGQQADDIVGVATFGVDTPLGDPSHLALGATGDELVIVVRGDLLLRYPATVVYLQSAVHPPAAQPDFESGPADTAPRVLPGFHGRLGVDVAFYGFPAVAAIDIGQSWLVFEEPPAGYRFANDVATTVTSGHAWAAATLADPVRVLIRGDSLPAGGGG